MDKLSPFISHLSPRAQRWQKRALMIGILAALLSLSGAFFDRAQFFRSYLFAWLFWCGISLGALVIVMLQFLTGGEWGKAVRGLAIAVFRTLPLVALLFIPVVLGLHDIYSWSNGWRGETGAYHDKAQYLNAPFFSARSIFYFAVLIAFAVLLRKRSPNSREVIPLSAGGLIIYVLCMNFASTDWVMSLDPKWYSTIFIEIFVSGQFLAALALVTLLLAM